ncbi:hypothetical protein H7F15_03790 [Pontibacter sp. Tf4]|uniref:hypothetical protein n=1 Tax=Pontibacter sp. Tf4 TaxID=2761620 RepID=UPI001623F3B1|nr:hypothetical protein [Pontibacter sp. Tf4]MBB6610150.1 hypothetical protein [Pontibacter sp. Tf4]
MAFNMKTVLAPAVALLLCAQVSFAQTEDLRKVSTDLKGKITEVQTAKIKYQQQLNFKEPYLLQYEFTQTDEKGKAVTYMYEFNMADLDPYAVTEVTQKDKLLVKATVRNNQKLIKVYKDREVQPYVSSVELISKDIDNARALKELLKAGIPMAEKLMEKKLKLTTYDAQVDWLTQNVKPVELGDKIYKQAFAKGDHVGTIRFQNTEVDKQKSEDHVYTFNLADINPNSIKFKISGNQFIVGFETVRDQKVVKYTKNSAPGNFTNQVSVVVNNVEDARDLKTVLNLVIPQAQEKVKAAMPAVANQQEALKLLSSFIKPVKYGELTIEQTINAGCVATLQQVSQTAGKTEKEVYELNLMDLNENLLDYSISGQKMSIEVKVKDKAKLVKYSKDDVLKSYNDDVKIYTEDVEVARRLAHVLGKAIVGCRDNYKMQFSGKAPDKVKWLISNIGELSLDGKTVTQKFALVDAADINKLKYTTVESDSKKTVEEIYEFNLTDINPKSVNYSVKGTWLSVTMETNFKDKIIKYYKDGKIQAYTNTVEIKLNDTEKARNVIAALSESITELKK